jgi:hypothetical protein
MEKVFPLLLNVRFCKEFIGDFRALTSTVSLLYRYRRFGLLIISFNTFLTCEVVGEHLGE